MLRSFALRTSVLFKARWKRMLIYNIYFRRSGFYRFALKNLIYLLVIGGALIGIFSYVERHIIDLGQVFGDFVSTLETNWVYTVFFLSESLLGLLPPDFFLIWAGNLEHPWLAVTWLSILSYAGGVISFYLGKGLSYQPRIARFIGSKYKKNFSKVKKWGGIFIVLAALFPLPFSIVCLLAGLLRFPPPLFFAFSATRFIRFYAYAWAIFAVV
jgi:membrane protein YqaA with SNARE-associated domain